MVIIIHFKLIPKYLNQSNDLRMAAASIQSSISVTAMHQTLLAASYSYFKSMMIPRKSTQVTQWTCDLEVLVSATEYNWTLLVKHEIHKGKCCLLSLIGKQKSNRLGYGETSSSLPLACASARINGYTNRNGQLQRMLCPWTHQKLHQHLPVISLIFSIPLTP